MWGLAGVVDTGVGACLALSSGHPAGGPRLSSHIGKTLFLASSCLLRCPSGQTREACDLRNLAGMCAFVAEFCFVFFPWKNSVLGLSLKLLRGPRTWAKCQEPVGYAVNLHTFLTSGLEQAPKQISEGLWLWTRPPGSHQRPAVPESCDTQLWV